MVLLPPRNDDYATLEELVNVVQAHASKEGYAIVKGRSKSIKGNGGFNNKINLYCDRGGQPRKGSENAKRKRRTSSIKIGCPFRANAIRRKGSDVWGFEVTNGEHNHEETDPKACASLRTKEHDRALLNRLDAASKAGMYAPHCGSTLTSIIGIAPREFLASERLNNPSSLLIAQDIYNAKKKIRGERLGKYTPTQALLKHLNHDRWFVKVKLRKDTKEIRRLFFLNKKSGHILRKNFEVLVMDCTYKTNKYKMPLLTIVGQTSIGTTFHVGFAFLESERPEDYVWVLKHLKDAYGALGLPDPNIIVTDRDLALLQASEEVFPNTAALLCIWHVNKNVLKNCKASFTTEEAWVEFQAAWHQVLFAHTEADCYAAWEMMLTRYARTNKEDLDYIYNIWLTNWLEKICSWKTNEVLHFGSTTTQRVEGIHRVLKTLLKFSTGDIMTVVDRIETMLLNQRKEFRSKIASAKRKIPFEFRPTVWQDLIGRVTPHAL
jgi:hypothetical protein